MLNPNLDRCSPLSAFLNPIDQVGSHTFRPYPDLIRVQYDEPIGNVNVVDVTDDDAVPKCIEVATVPFWSTNGREERIIDIVPAVPACGV